MPYTLPEIVARMRVIGGLKTVGSATTNDVSSNNEFAMAAAEAQTYLAREIGRMGTGPDLGNNSGTFMKVFAAVPVDGVAFLPPDVPEGGLFPGTADTDEYTAYLSGGSNYGALHGGSGCGSGYLVQHDRVIFPAGTTETKYFAYNSNLRSTWTAGTATGGSTTTLIASATPTYSLLPLVNFDDFYNGQTISVTDGDGVTVQTARVKDYAWATRTFTIYGTWPTFSPANTDAWSLTNRVGHDDLLLYQALVPLVPFMTENRVKMIMTLYEQRMKAFQAAVSRRPPNPI